MVLAPCNLKQIREIIIWYFVIKCELLYFCRKMGIYVVIYNKDRNVAQINLVELVGDPVAPMWNKTKVK